MVLSSSYEANSYHISFNSMHLLSELKIFKYSDAITSFWTYFSAIFKSSLFNGILDCSLLSLRYRLPSDGSGTRVLGGNRIL